MHERRRISIDVLVARVSEVRPLNPFAAEFLSSSRKIVFSLLCTMETFL